MPLNEYPLSDFLPKHQAEFYVSGTVVCSEAARNNLVIVAHGGPRAARDYTVRLSHPNFQGRIRLSLGPGSGRVQVETKGSLGIDVRLWRECSLTIGEGTTINSAKIVADSSDIEIGEDNLWSDEILVQSNNQHGVYDLEAGSFMQTGRTSVKTAGHVWIGRRAVLMANSAVGWGSIVGTSAVLTKPTPDFTIAAGNPARVIAEKRTWSRVPHRFTRAELDAINARFGNDLIDPEHALAP